MALTEAEKKDAPKITLGGSEFAIPRLALKQNRVVVAGLKKLLPLLAELEKTAEAAKQAVASGAGPGAAGMAMLDAFPIDEVSFDTLCDVVYAATTRARPEFSRAEFDDLPVGVDELMMALPVIMGQTFAFARRGDAQPAGEAQAPSGAPATTDQPQS